MKVFQNMHHLPGFKKATITIGTFDGVHLGHKKILAQLVAEAKKVGGTTLLITFYPHPKAVVANSKNPVFYLTTQEEKYSLIEKEGIEYIVEVPFDKSFSEQSAKDYIESFLVKKFNPKTIIIGYDHRFGKNREGDYELLETSGKKWGFNVIEIPEELVQNIIISSTKIRDALLDGDPETAKLYLGYDYFFSGIVVEGNRLGRTIGYPTANIYVEKTEKLIPGNGVYAVDVRIENDETLYKGMMNIGVRPTINGTKRVTEVNIFDFDKEIYGHKLTITIKQKLRAEIKFNGLEELKLQLAADERNARTANP